MIAWAMVIGLACTLFVMALILIEERKESLKKDQQIKMLMERIWNLKKLIKEDGIV